MLRVVLLFFMMVAVVDDGDLKREGDVGNVAHLFQLFSCNQRDALMRNEPLQIFEVHQNLGWRLLRAL